MCRRRLLNIYNLWPFALNDNLTPLLHQQQGVCQWEDDDYMTCTCASVFFYIPPRQKKLTNEFVLENARENEGPRPIFHACLLATVLKGHYSTHTHTDSTTRKKWSIKWNEKEKKGEIFQQNNGQEIIVSVAVRWAFEGGRSPSLITGHMYQRGIELPSSHVFLRVPVDV